VIWSINTSVAFLAVLHAGGGAGAAVIGFSAGVTLLITVLAWIKRADVEVTISDRLFFIAALVAMPLWHWMADPFWAVLLITMIELLGFGPTLRKTWAQPFSESVTFYALMLLRNLLVIAAMDQITLTTALFPGAMAAVCVGLIALMAWRRPLLAPPASIR
jgi:hypothetical protein